MLMNPLKKSDLPACSASPGVALPGAAIQCADAAPGFDPWASSHIEKETLNYKGFECQVERRSEGGRTCEGGKMSTESVTPEMLAFVQTQADLRFQNFVAALIENTVKMQLLSTHQNADKLKFIRLILDSAKKHTESAPQ